MSISVEHINDSAKLQDAVSVRAEVFQVEQGISATDDCDGLDAGAEQFVAYEAGIPIGTARYRVISAETGKVERVATLREHRGKMVGHSLMESIATAARQKGLAKLVLDSQLSSASFYENLGYEREGEEFNEVGIAHIKMVLELGPTLPVPKEYIDGNFRRHSGIQF